MGISCPEEPPFYAGDTLHKVKQQKIRDAMRKYDFDAFLLIKSEAVRYVTDFYVKGYRPFMDLEYFVLVSREEEPILGFSSGSDFHRLNLRSPVRDFRKISGHQGWIDAIKQALIDAHVSNGKIGTDMLPFDIYLALKSSLPKVEFVSANEMWIDITAVKHPEEVKILRESIRITEAGAQAAIEAIKPGVKETEVAAKAEYVMRTLGSEMVPFLTNIASGENAAIFERISTEKKIRKGELVIIDVGAVYRGYTGDMGRTICVGSPSKEQREIYKICYEALQSAISMVRPGVKCSEVDAVARDKIKELGFEKYGHKFATGHQLGYGLHGEPLVNKGSEYRLKPNMVIALEPRVTVYDNPRIGGVHLEENILVTETGHEILTRTPFSEELLG